MAAFGPDGKRPGTPQPYRRTPRAPRPQPPKPQPPPRSQLWIVAAILLALVLVAVIAWRLLRAPTSTETPTETPSPAPEAAAVAPATTAPVPVADEPPAGTGIPEASVEQLLAQQTQGDWLIRRLSGAPAILVVEFPDLQSQGQTLNRAAALLEKAGGRRDRVLSDAELGRLLRSTGDSVSTFYFGHDYLGSDLARFYRLAQSQGLTLNAQELRLRRLLLDAGMLREASGGQYQGIGMGVLVSFSSVQPASSRDREAYVDATRRDSILRHELSHGRYYTDPAYRRHCEFVWRQLLSDAEREVWRRYLGSQDYDTANEDLMINEMQALLMHTSDVRDFSAKMLSWKEADLEGLRQRFRLGWSG